VLCVLGYVALAWAVRFDLPQGDQIASLVYPLDTFSMYAQAPSPQMSYMLIRDSGGVHQITDFRSFDCSGSVTGDVAPCAGGRPIQYLHDDQIHYIQDHRGSGGDDAELVIRTWQLQPGAPVLQTADCVVAQCRVSR
jgi:hypothetical protein